MSGYDQVDHYIRDWEREEFEYLEWLEARELERADTLAERGGEHRPLAGKEARFGEGQARNESGVTGQKPARERAGKGKKTFGQREVARRAG